MVKHLPKRQHQRWNLVTNPNTDLETLELLAADPDERIRFKVAEHPNASTALLTQLSLDCIVDVISGAASHPNLAMGDLLRLAQHPHKFVRRSVAGNPNVTSEILESFSEDPDLLFHLAKNTKTRSETLRRLGVEQGHVCYLLARNPSTPYDMWIQLDSFRSSYVLRKLP